MKIKLSVLTIIAAVALPISSVFAGPDWQSMQHGFQKMDKTIEQADKTMNVKERQKYMNEHMKMMSTQSNMMHNMMDAGSMPGMGGGMGMKGKMDDKNTMTPEYMQKRMDMMQMMMEQMMKQQNMMMKNMK